MYFKNKTRSLLTAGLLAGTLDILAASIQYYLRTGKGPANVLRYIASAVFGPKAFTGGTVMAAWGLFFHYVIAFLFTLFFFWLYPRFEPVRKNIILTGILYGAFVWAVMNLVVVPLSAAPAGPIVLKKAIVALLILVGCISFPVVLIARKHYLYTK